MAVGRRADPAPARKARRAAFYEDQRLRQLIAYARKMQTLGDLARTMLQISTGRGRTEELTAAVCAVLLHIPRRSE
jgi:hypothetical protein